MRLPKYQLKSGQQLSSYEFISEGPNGFIIKRVQFTLLNTEGVYNLAFGDKDPQSGEIDDLSISNNGDSEKVLATVVAAVYAFCDKHPECWIFITGSTQSRTRLYRMGISKFLDELELDFDVYGRFNEEWEPFEIGKTYSAFLAYRKKS
jgi:hypothetical protein